MKRFFPLLLGAGLLLFAGGCVTEKIHTIDLTGDIMIDAPRAIAEGPAKDRSLWEYRLAAAAMRRGDYATAKKNLDDALLTLREANDLMRDCFPGVSPKHHAINRHSF